MENILTHQDLDILYQTRFSPLEIEKKEKLWKCLVYNYLQKYFNADMTILDIGCGFCEFINFVNGKKKYAYDIEAAFRNFAGTDVEFILGEEGKPIPLTANICDRIFVSNFFEHLSSRQMAKFILRESFRILKPAGSIIVIQPNIALVGEKYWDFFDHILPFTEKSLLEAMEMVGFKKRYIKRRFLPYTTKGNKLNSTFLLRLYLKIPIFQWIFGKQSLIIADKPND